MSWQSSPKGKWESDVNAFIFSLTYKGNRPLKMKIDPNRHKHAIGCHSSFGPSFGGFFDIKIANNANTTMDSFSNLIVFKIPIHDTRMTQMKQKPLWLDRSSFNWMKLKSFKENKYRKRN